MVLNADKTVLLFCNGYPVPRPGEMKSAVLGLQSSYPGKIAEGDIKNIESM